VEQELSDRCINEDTAKRFMDLMVTYNKRAEEGGSGFYANIYGTYTRHYQDSVYQVKLQFNTR